MNQSANQTAHVHTLRQWLLGALILGLFGTQAELLLLEHYEDPWQFIPLALIGLAIAALAWRTLRRDRISLLALRGIMVLFLIAGVLGLGLHFRGAAAFQLELNPAMSTWELTKKVMRAKAPPVLAPGVMLQLGLIGLAYAFADSRKQKELVP